MALERFPRESPSHSVCGRYRYGQGCGLSVFHLGVGLQNLSAWFPAAGGPLVEFARVGMWLFYLPAQVLISLSVKRK